MKKSRISSTEPKYFLNEKTGSSFMGRLLDRVSDGISRAALSICFFTFKISTAGTINDLARARKEKADPALAYFNREKKYGKGSG